MIGYMIDSNTILKIGLGLSIVVALVVTLTLGVSIIWPEPRYEDFCGKVKFQAATTSEQCAAIGGDWVVNAAISAKMPPSEVSPNVNPATGYCDQYRQCSALETAARDKHEKISFFIFLAFGLLFSVVGHLFIKPWPIAFGFTYGGFVSIFIAGVRYWGRLGDFVKFGAVLVVLIALIMIGLKKYKQD